MVNFKGQLALITGAGSGIGEALAYQFAKKGTHVILTGRRRANLEKVKSNCEKMGVKGYVFELDLQSYDSIDSLASALEENSLRPDFIILNAGISQRALTLETDFEVDMKLMNTNYFGSVYLIKKLKKILLESQVTHIAVNTSISGLFGFPLRSAYCASKRALFGFFESLALEYPNIKVTFIIPGRINTEISRSAVMGDGSKFGEMDPGQANGMDVNKCARIAIRAIAKERHKKLIGGKELLMAYIYKYIPWLYYILARKVSAH